EYRYMTDPPGGPRRGPAWMGGRVPLVGNRGWFNRSRERPRLIVLCTPGGSPNRLALSSVVNCSYVVRESEYPTTNRDQRSTGSGKPKRTLPPVRRRCPSAKLMNRSRALNSATDPFTRVPSTDGSP